MNILRLSTVSLTLAIAVFALGYANPSFAAPKDCVDGDPRPSCPKDDEDPIEVPAEYEAALTVGGFIFEPLIVTLNKRKNAYHGQKLVEMDRPGDEDDGMDQSAWDSVFRTCLALLPSDIGAVTTGRNWTINISGSKLNGSVSNNPDSDILIRFRDVVAHNPEADIDFDNPEVDIDFNLIGKIGYEDEAETKVNIFLPDIDMTSSFTLDTFNFFASGSQGGGCRSGILGLYPPSVLEITRTK